MGVDRPDRTGGFQGFHHSDSNLDTSHDQPKGIHPGECLTT